MENNSHKRKMIINKDILVQSYVFQHI